MDKFDKTLCLHSLTVMEKKLAEIRTKMADKNISSPHNFDGFEKMLIGNALGFKACCEMFAFNFKNGSRFAEEQKIWSIDD